MWRKLRIAILLFILVGVSYNAWLESHQRQWKKSLYVMVYPLNMDGSSAASRYIRQLQSDEFEEIAEYFAKQGVRSGLSLKQPFELRLGPPILAPQIGRPPPQPAVSMGAVSTIIWSLKFRWWAYRNTPTTILQPDIKLYLLYFDPAKHVVLPHSTALSKGRMGLVNVFAHASYSKQNNVVIAHELLHTVGASDKYNLANLQPAYPEGYAEPDKLPLYPQTMAELMAGRRPISETQAQMPGSLQDTVIGKLTASEIGWGK